MLLPTETALVLGVVQALDTELAGFARSVAGSLPGGVLTEVNGRVIVIVDIDGTLVTPHVERICDLDRVWQYRDKHRPVG
jgi:hypothetical protein